MNQKRGSKTPSPMKTTPKKRKTPIKHTKKGKNVETQLDLPSQSETLTTKVKSGRTPKNIKSSSTPNSRKSSPRKKFLTQIMIIVVHLVIQEG